MVIISLGVHVEGAAIWADMGGTFGLRLAVRLAR
jgi:hypothetical protein